MDKIKSMPKARPRGFLGRALLTSCRSSNSAIIEKERFLVLVLTLEQEIISKSELDGDLAHTKNFAREKCCHGASVTLLLRNQPLELVMRTPWWTISIPFASSDAQSNQERHFEVFIGQAIRNSVSSIKTNHLTDHIATVAGTREMMALRFECSANGIFNVIEAKTSSKNRNFRKKVIWNFFRLWRHSDS